MISMLKQSKTNPSMRQNPVSKIDVKSILDGGGWFVKSRPSQSPGRQFWARLTLYQCFTQLFGWIYIFKSLVTVFLIDDDSEWNHYLGDFSSAFGKLNSIINHF